MLGKFKIIVSGLHQGTSFVAGCNPLEAFGSDLDSDTPLDEISAEFVDGYGDIDAFALGGDSFLLGAHHSAQAKLPAGHSAIDGRVRHHGEDHVSASGQNTAGWVDGALHSRHSTTIYPPRFTRFADGCGSEDVTSYPDLMKQSVRYRMGKSTGKWRRPRDRCGSGALGER